MSIENNSTNSNNNSNNDNHETHRKDDDNSAKGRTELHGLLVTYADDQLDDCINLALKKKSRVKYKCMDTCANYLAFGTSGGAIYLFKLKSVTHSSCKLALMIPCDQGSIEVLKFLPNFQTDDLLVAIGTVRGSVIVFKLSKLPGEDNITCNEIYRAENFTNGCSIKMIEYDQDLLDLNYSFNKLYICDIANRIYLLDGNNIGQAKQTLRFFYSNHLPSLIFSINDSNINQLSIHGSQLLISTDETTRLFDEQTNQIRVIGKKKRKIGYYGACFFDSNSKPSQLPSSRTFNQHLPTSSTNSLNDNPENLLIFVSRPVFRLWQVSYNCEVKYTHQFESLIKTSRYRRVLEMQSEPLDEGSCDDPQSILSNLISIENLDEANKQLKSDHFQHLQSIFSSTLGNLLLSYTKNELFIIDPIGAKLVAWYSQELPIIQICCNDNEIYVWSLMNTDAQVPNPREQNRRFQFKRIVLLAPTQFVLELHRTHRYITLMMFVQMFSDMFCEIMALPLTSPSVITTEGGLLRNILLNAWDVHKTSKDHLNNIDEEFIEFTKIIDLIIDESKQLRHSLDNLNDSRFLLTLTNENIDRLCSEPYTSLVSLEISLANLHTNHVIHFSKEALNRRRSIANLSQSIKNLQHMKQMAKSNFDVARKPGNQIQVMDDALPFLSTTSVIVERQRPKRLKPKDKLDASAKFPIDPITEQNSSSKVENVSKEVPATKEAQLNGNDLYDDSIKSSTSKDSVKRKETAPELLIDELNDKDQVMRVKCPNCSWPLPASHLYPVSGSQRRISQWIEENLLDNLDLNIAKIEELAFKHGLWILFLKCLEFQGKLDDYITCCVALDDVRLLNIEKFVITHCNELEILDRLLTNLTDRLDEKQYQQSNSDTNEMKIYCLKCNSRVELILEDYKNMNYSPAVQIIDRKEFCFELVNILEQFMVRPNANIQKLVGRLLKYPKLLNTAKIPPSFYLKALTMATMAANTLATKFGHRS